MIVSRENPKLKLIRRIRRGRDAEHVFLEGPHLIREAILTGSRLEFVLASAEFLAGPEGRELESRLERPASLIEGRLLDEVVDAHSPRGVVAVAEYRPRSVADLPVSIAGPLVFAEGLQDPGNLGALARSAEASGATALAIAGGSAQPRHPRALRASAGSLLRLPVAVDATLQEIETRYAAQSPRVAALTPREGEDLYSADLGGPLIIVVGAEGRGLSVRAAGAADLLLTIPTESPVESLNTTVAASLVLFEIVRRSVRPDRS